MLQAFLDIVERLVKEFTWPRLIAILMIIAFSFTLIASYEWYTAHFQLGRLEDSINLLAKLQEINKAASIQQGSHLKSIYINLLAELDELVSRQSTGVVFGVES